MECPASWTEYLTAAHDGDEWAKGELLRLVAHTARSLGQSGQPPSRLMGAIGELCRSVRHATSLTDELVAVAADAHCLGTADAVRNQFEAILEAHAPIVESAHGVTVYIIGPLPSTAVASILSRAIRKAITRGHKSLRVQCPGSDQRHSARVIAAARKLSAGTDLDIG